MSIKTYQQMKKDFEEAIRLLDLIDKEQEQGIAKFSIERVKASIVSYHLSAVGQEVFTDFLREYIALAANNLAPQIIAEARNLMINHLKNEAIDAQEECIQLLQQIGQDKQ